MKLYKDLNDNIFAYEEDGSQDDLIGTKTLITQAEADVILSTPKTVDEAKEKKLYQIESDFNLAESQTVTVNGISYEGGRSSAESIDGYVRVNRLAGISVHNIWDHQGTESPLTDAEADAVIVAIGSASSANRFNKKNRKVALASLPANATISDIEAI